jgi:hypothetical protein
VSHQLQGRQVHDVQFFLITIRDAILHCNLLQVGRQLVRERLVVQRQLHPSDEFYMDPV